MKLELVRSAKVGAISFNLNPIWASLSLRMSHLSMVLITLILVLRFGELSALSKLPVAGDTNGKSGTHGLKQKLNDDFSKELVFLESIEDLSHLTYLLLRNYNITDESLLQSSWLLSLGTALSSHKQHQYATEPISMSDTKARLALELESFISHLRNGHLRRMTMDDLELLVLSMNLTETIADLQKYHIPDKTANERSRSRTRDPSRDRDKYETQIVLEPSTSHLTETNDKNKRCDYLVAMYKYELNERSVKQQRDQQISSTNQQEQSSGANTSYSKITYADPTDESAPKQPATAQKNLTILNSNLNESFVDTLKLSDNNIRNDSVQSPTVQESPVVDNVKLLRLCKLAISCQSAEDMVNLITVPWISSKLTTASDDDDADDDADDADDNIGTQYSDSSIKVDEEQAERQPRHRRSGSSEMYSSNDMLREDIDLDQKWQIQRRRNLRDSLSLSLAKLCPLILFQLHEDDSQCIVARDDTPPMLAVWGFATLFVTIVSFCSLIGLSITPLIGHSTSADSASDGSSSSSSSSESSLRWSRKPSSNSNSQHQPLAQQPPQEHTQTQQQPQHQQVQIQQHPDKQHKATLTVFEGLAVGSLVGSALFSLIPQAFELQERESNQSFLMKAFIIFSGIYLFFCSERIMRIILDTRQMNKRNKRLLTRGSTTAANMAAAAAAAAAAATNPLDKTSPVVQTVGSSFPQEQKNGCHIAPSSVVSPPLEVKCAQLTDKGTNVETLGRAAPIHTEIDLRRDVNNQNKLCSKRAKDKVIKKVKSKKRYGVRILEAMNDQERCKSSSSDDSEFRLNTAINQIVSASHLQSGSSRRKFHDLMNDQNSATNQYYCDEYDEYCSLSSDYLYGSSETSSYDEDDANLSDRHHNDIWSDQDDNEKATSLRKGPVSWNESELVRHRINRDISSAKLKNVDKALYESESNAAARSGRGRLDSNDHIDLQASITPEREISTVAWMIILGDGLHNFIDGISIGAAFSESILSGVSISVAVICEEFPHELGDFAVLVSSGMTVRQALGYNFLSACTCYFGMAIGIILGDVTDGASYISALAAGVFLYIALVDMMGELSAALEASSRDSIGRTLKLFLLQNVGIFIGISIIFVLSFIDF